MPYIGGPQENPDGKSHKQKELSEASYANKLHNLIVFLKGNTAFVNTKS